MVAEEASFSGHLQFEIKGGKIVVNEVEWSAIVIESDYESAEALVKNPLFHSRTKHTLDKHHFTRDRIAEGEWG